VSDEVHSAPEATRLAIPLQDVESTLRRARKEVLWVPGPGTARLDVRGEGLTRLLAHRPPFLLIDAITALDPQEEALEAAAWIDPEDAVLKGHFPGRPTWPGALLVEMLAEVAGCLRPLESGEPPLSAFATSYRGVFLRPVLPGDTLRLLVVRVGSYDGVYERAVGQVLRGDEICALAYIEACHVEA
jgi:3-hydroxyacyl-[acyl-carrier-protein] dehydratase